MTTFEDFDELIAALRRAADEQMRARVRDRVRTAWPWMLRDPVSEVAWSPAPITAYRLSQQRPLCREGWLTASCRASGYLVGSAAFNYTPYLDESVRSRIDHQGPAPDPGCSCGFYAYRESAARRRLWSLSLPSSDVWVSRVELAGRVIEHEHGYRAERMRFMVPQAIRVRVQQLSVFEVLRRNMTFPHSGGGTGG